MRIAAFIILLIMISCTCYAGTISIKNASQWTLLKSTDSDFQEYIVDKYDHDTQICYIVKDAENRNIPKKDLKVSTTPASLKEKNIKTKSSLSAVQVKKDTYGYCYTPLKEEKYIKFGNHSTEYVWQEASQVIYEDNNISTSFTLKKYNGFDYSIEPESIWVRNQSECAAIGKDGLCFGAVDYSLAEDEIGSYMYEISSNSKIISMSIPVYKKMNNMTSIGFFYPVFYTSSDNLSGESRQKFNFYDICSKSFSNCSWTNEDGIVRIYFNAHDIDPEINDVDACMTISDPGYYALTQDIDFGEPLDCISIYSDDVVLDGKGHFIKGAIIDSLYAPDYINIDYVDGTTYTDTGTEAFGYIIRPYIEISGVKYFDIDNYAEQWFNSYMVYSSFNLVLSWDYNTTSAVSGFRITFDDSYSMEPPCGFYGDYYVDVTDLYYNDSSGCQGWTQCDGDCFPNTINSNNYGIYAANFNNITIKNITVINFSIGVSMGNVSDLIVSDSNFSMNGVYGLDGYSWDDADISNIEVGFNYDNGVCASGNNIYFHDSFIHNNLQMGFSSLGSVTNSRFHNLTFGYNENSDLLFIEGSKNVDINGIYSDYGIWVFDSSYFNVSNIYVDTSKTPPYSTAIYLYSVNNSIFKNITAVNKFYGIHSSVNSLNNIFSDIHTINSSASFYIESFSNNSRYDNIDIYNGSMGILVVGSSNNLFRNISINKMSDSGVIFGANSKNNSMYDLVVSSSAVSGFKFSSAKNCTLDGYMSNSNLYGMYSESSLGNSLRNMYSYNDSNSLRVYASSNNTFENISINSSRADALIFPAISSAKNVNNSFLNLTIINTNPSYNDLKSEKNISFSLIYPQLNKYSIANSTISIENEYGIIRFLLNINSSGNNLLSDVLIGNNSAYVNSSKSGLNQSANITLKNIGNRGFINPEILKDGESCLECVAYNSLTSENVLFSVPSWTSYSIGSLYTSPDGYLEYDYFMEVNTTERIYLYANTSLNNAFFVLNGTQYLMSVDGARFYIDVVNNQSEDIPFSVNMTSLLNRTSNIFDGVMRWRTPFYLTISVYKKSKGDNETTLYKHDFQYIYLKKEGQVDSYSTILNGVDQLNAVLGLKKLATETAFWSELNGGIGTVKLYEPGNYSINLETTKSKTSIPWNYEFIIPQADGSVYTEKLASVEISEPSAQSIKIYATMFEITQARGWLEIVKLIFIIIFGAAVIILGIMSGIPGIAFAGIISGIILIIMGMHGL